MHDFWPVEEFVVQEKGHTVCVEGVREEGCVFAWNMSVARSTIPTEAKRRNRPDMTLTLHK